LLFVCICVSLRRKLLSCVLEFIICPKLPAVTFCRWASFINLGSPCSQNCSAASHYGVTTTPLIASVCGGTDHSLLPLLSHLATAETHKQESIFCPCQCRETERKRVASTLQRLRAMTTILVVNETHSEVIRRQKINRKEKWGDGEEKEKKRE